MCKFILRQDIPWNISSSFWICLSAGKGSDAFGVDHASETAWAQRKHDVWGTKRGQQCTGWSLVSCVRLEMLCLGCGSERWAMPEPSKPYREWEGSSFQTSENNSSCHILGPFKLTLFPPSLKTSHLYFPVWLLCSLQEVKEKCH